MYIIQFAVLNNFHQTKILINVVVEIYTQIDVNQKKFAGGLTNKTQIQVALY
jgi:hypothetical protein